jgi:spore germination protein KC
MINESKHLVKVPILKTYEVINALAIPKFHIVLPTVVSYSNDGKDTNQLSGGSVFNKGKLVGFLKEEDIIPYLFIKNKVESGILNIKAPKANPDDIIILKIFGSNTKITPKYGDETIGFDVIVKTDVSIGELTTMTDYISTQGRENLKILAEESLEKEIVNFIKNIQDEFGFDIFGFGNIIRQRNPKMWTVVENDWDSIFMDMDINVVCDIQIKNSGYTLKTIKVVD